MINIKTDAEIEIMKQGGARLARVKEELHNDILPGATGKDIDKKAENLILKLGGRPSFKMVKNYYWSSCVNINEGVVHGVPSATPFIQGDIVSVDIGMFYKGFHTDTSFTVPVGKVDKETQKFLKVGEETLGIAIKQATAGNRISQVSKTIQTCLEANGYSPVRALIGHGIGKNLHEEPQIPCFWEGKVEYGEPIPQGAVLAVEVIYSMGLPDLVLSSEDNWTISTKDAKIAGLFEETVAVTSTGPLVLTA